MLWGKLWTTLRATRDTELRESFPSHVVAKWIGHDDRVAERHYLQITDAHFEKAVQNPVQYSAVSARIGSHGQNGNNKEKMQNEAVQKDADSCDVRELQQVGSEGLERPLAQVA